MDLKKYFETTTEKFEFTVDLGGWKKKKVLEFIPKNPVSDAVMVQRQAFAGLLWSKQYYNYELETWLNGDTCALKYGIPKWLKISPVRA